MMSNIKNSYAKSTRIGILCGIFPFRFYKFCLWFEVKAHMNSKVLHRHKFEILTNMKAKMRISCAEQFSGLNDSKYEALKKIPLWLSYLEKVEYFLYISTLYFK